MLVSSCPVLSRLVFDLSCSGLASYTALLYSNPKFHSPCLFWWIFQTCVSGSPCLDSTATRCAACLSLRPANPSECSQGQSPPIRSSGSGQVKGRACGRHSTAQLRCYVSWLHAWIFHASILIRVRVWMAWVGMYMEARHSRSSCATWKHIGVILDLDLEAMRRFSRV